MKIAVLRETTEGERRVAATPETVKKFIGLGATLAVEAGAGAAATIADQAYADAGATVGDRASVLADADIILGVQGPDPASLAGAKRGAWLAAGLNPFGTGENGGRARVDGYAAAGIEALAMEFMPRITRAQSMDILSSQSNLVRLQGGARCGGRIWPRLPDDDDGGGHGFGRARLRHGRRRRRAAGDRDGAAARRAGFRHRRALGDQGADPVARRQADLRRERQGHRGRGHRAVMRPRCPRNIRRRRPSWSRRTSPSRTSSSRPR